MHIKFKRYFKLDFFEYLIVLIICLSILVFIWIML